MPMILPSASKSTMSVSPLAVVYGNSSLMIRLAFDKGKVTDLFCDGKFCGSWASG